MTMTQAKSLLSGRIVKTIILIVMAFFAGYFVHSFVVVPDNYDYILASTNYGNLKYCAAVQRANVYGCQFHPENSGEVGLQFLKNFLSI